MILQQLEGCSFLSIMHPGIAITLSVILSNTMGFPSYMPKIPNGAIIPDPCNGGLWTASGHTKKYGGAGINEFGNDFRNAGNKWTNELCLKDTDGDGITNGEELGDPDCVWKEGNPPLRADVITNPAICEPVGQAPCPVCGVSKGANASTSTSGTTLPNDDGKVDVTEVPDEGSPGSGDENDSINDSKMESDESAGKFSEESKENDADSSVKIRAGDTSSEETDSHEDSDSNPKNGATALKISIVVMTLYFVVL